MKHASVPLSWFSLSKHGRFDAQFWIRVAEEVARRGIDRTDRERVREVVLELEAQQ